MPDLEPTLSAPKPAVPRKRATKASAGQAARSPAVAADPPSAPPPSSPAVQPPGETAHDRPAPPSATPLRLTDALQLLSDCVQALREKGSTPTAAGLKVVMQRSSDGAFDETTLGFRNFRSFLALAQSTGLVVLAERLGDVVVFQAADAPPARSNTAPGRPASASPGGLDRARPVHAPGGHAPANRPVALPTGAKVRPDLWSATLDFGAWRYVYDVRADRAWRLPETAGPDETDAVRNLRLRLEQVPGHFLAPPRVGMEEQRAWMKAFAEGLDDPGWRERLADALTQERPLSAFASVVRSDDDIHRRWRGALLKAVVQRLEQWSDEHGLDLDIFRRPSDQATAAGRPSGQLSLQHPPAPPASAEAEIRARILAALGRMPLADLLRLPVPAEALLH